MAGVYFGSFLPAKGVGLGQGEKGLRRSRSPGVLPAGTPRELEATGLGQTPPGGFSLEARAGGSGAGPSRVREVPSGCGGGPAVPSQLKVTAKIQHFATLSPAS